MRDSITFTNQLTFFQKVRSFDYTLLTCIMLIGLIEFFQCILQMVVKFLSYQKSHIKILYFFTMMIIISFINIRVWHNLSYLFYFVTLLLLVWASFYGITASGSQRWINLYFINLQPSELMKIAIIACFAKYYHRAQIQDISKITNILVPIVVLILPIFLVISQPDLGTSILIALSGIIVLWLSGVNVKYFFYSFILFIISAPFIISFLKPYQKLRILTFLIQTKIH